MIRAYKDYTHITEGRINGVQLRLYPAAKRTVCVDRIGYCYLPMPAIMFAYVEATCPTRDYYRLSDCREAVRPGKSGHILCGAFCRDADPTYKSEVFALPFSSTHGYALCLQNGPHFLFNLSFDQMIAKFWGAPFTSCSLLGCDTLEQTMRVLERIRNDSSRAPKTFSHFNAAIEDVYRKSEYYLR